MREICGVISERREIEACEMGSINLNFCAAAPISSAPSNSIAGAKFCDILP